MASEGLRETREPFITDLLFRIMRKAELPSEWDGKSKQDSGSHTDS